MTNHSYFGIKMCFTVTIICKFVSSILWKILLDAVKDRGKKAGNHKLVELCYQNTQDQNLISATLALIHIGIGTALYATETSRFYNQLQLA